ncbi:MAG: hypothetical protein IPI30_22420 [Saprospiraceae bacterium]|nr:hypothetical protein [Candidatus Vicinibacter affinis]
MSSWIPGMYPLFKPGAVAGNGPAVCVSNKLEYVIALKVATVRAPSPLDETGHKPRHLPVHWLKNY